MKTNTNITQIGKDIYVFAITGGPCGGKTSGLALLKKEFEARGYVVLIVPEAATNIIGAGVFHGESHLPPKEFQKLILQYALMQEELFLQTAMQYRDMGKKVVVFCDRGLLDGEAYVSSDEFTEVLDGFGYTRVELSEYRYHGVYFLQSVAVGRPDLYTTKNNESRTEDVAGAQLLDCRTQEVWHSHPHFRLFGNDTDFETKLRKLYVEVSAQIGDPVPIERERKFLVSSVDLSSITELHSVADITQTYLHTDAPDEVVRVRRRESSFGISYYYTHKKHISSGESLEDERIISRREYDEFLALRDQTRSPVRKKRISFHWNGGFYEIDFFMEPEKHKNLILLEVERPEKSDMSAPVVIPPFVKVASEVTDDPMYSNYMLSTL
ncbi:MAG: hypothetical protein FGM57_02050 [Candidatus Taylorbacteria bacterium]|nr:hypothetical protein [Candidatus Taylorbacteria bacterium]